MILPSDLTIFIHVFFVQIGDEIIATKDKIFIFLHTVVRNVSLLVLELI